MPPNRPFNRAAPLALVCLAFAAWFSGCALHPPLSATFGKGERSFTLAASELVESGLVAALCQAFVGTKTATIRLIHADDEHALQLLKEGRVDAALVHAPAAEERALREGWAGSRTLVAAHRFLILGPTDDPADVRGAFCSLDAFRRIHRLQTPFVSPADPAIHRKEMNTWRRAQLRPWGDWYIEEARPTVSNLAIADAGDAYILADRRQTETMPTQHLAVLFSESEDLIDPYHVLVAPTGATPGSLTAADFAAFVASDEGQQIVRHFGTERFGARLYEDAASTRQALEDK